MGGGAAFGPNAPAANAGPRSSRQRPANSPVAARRAPADYPHVISAIPVDEDASPESGDLLQGVRDANNSNQVKQSQKLKGRYEKGGANSPNGKGMGGIGAGGVM